ncbi:hypothetical protein QZN00_09440 [Burkholderia multivorans]|nr:hypothetical protein [Burkholderia multivorans]
MNKAIISGGLTLSAADLIPAVNWALGGFHGAVPANLSALIAGAVVMAIHAGYNWLVARAAAKAAAAQQ